jgi:membrane-associated phospholipid phosphatase
MPMVLLVSLVPLYIFIAAWARGRPASAPATSIDAWVPFQPVWVLVYGPLYLWLILLPVFVIQQQEHIRRTVLAYLMVWTSAYVVFLMYPTIASRPEEVSGPGFAIWGLRFLYDADPPYNCFPSLHVAHSFVSAFASARVNRPLGVIAILAAALVGVSTLFTKQHYVLDVVAGALLATVAYLVFLHTYPSSLVPVLERRLAPIVATCVVGIVAIVLALYWVLYRLSA